MSSTAETDACRRLLALALAEDLGTLGDLTSKALIPPQKQRKAVIAARTPGVLAGLPAVEMVLAAVDPALQLQPQRRDGDRLSADDAVVIIGGPTRVSQFCQLGGTVAVLDRPSGARRRPVTISQQENGCSRATDRQDVTGASCSAQFRMVR